MTPKLTALALAGLIQCPPYIQPARAESLALKTDLSPGAYVVVSRTYHSDTNTLSEGAPPGEEKACFQVVEHTEEGVVLAHLTGFYHPWWSDVPIQPGDADAWFTSDAWRENNPGAGKLDELFVIFSNVPTCKNP
jgi:hypothetical protein